MANHSRKWLPTALVLLAGTTIAIFLFYGKPAPQQGVVASAPVALVDVMTVMPESLALNVNTQGSVQPRREIDMVAQVSGEVVSVAPFYAEGGFFEASATLVEIDDRDYQFGLMRAEARVADAAQILATEEGRARQAQREWRDLGDKSANALFLRKPQLASAQAALAAATAERDQALLDIERTHIAPPFAGRILETFVDLGQYITPGTPVARIYSTDAVEVRLPLTDRQVSLLELPLNYQAADAPSLRVPVRLSGRFGGEIWHWQGFITRTDARIDVNSRVVYAVAEVEDPFNRTPAKEPRPPLIIGQFVEASIAGKTVDNVVLLPQRALRPQNQVWLVDQQSRLRIITVEVLQSNHEMVAVRGDFGARASVVVSALAIALPGMQLSVRESKSLAGPNQ